MSVATGISSKAAQQLTGKSCNNSGRHPALLVLRNTQSQPVLIYVRHLSNAVGSRCLNADTGSEGD